MTEQVTLSGSALLRRSSGDDHGEAVVTLDILLNARDALVRIGSRAGGHSHFRGFRHPVSLWTLGEIDQMIEAILYRNSPITPRFKGSVTKSGNRSSDLLPPPLGYVWCPKCLGCLNRSQTCPVCDGNRVVRHADA